MNRSLQCPRRLTQAVACIGIFVSLGLVPALGAADPVIALPKADRERIEKDLGTGIVGKAMPAPAIKDPATFVGAKNRSWKFRITAGKTKGTMETHTFEQLKRDATGTTWKFTAGKDNVSYARTVSDGSIHVVSEEDRKQGVISRFNPPEPLWIANLKPGEVKKTKIDVKVYDLTDPKDVSHSGYLNLTYTYVGAYEVTVPAGKFTASLLKWEYKGKIGPASVEDVQYRFLAKDVGPVAMIDKRDVSAFLVYQDHTKFGKVLVEAVSK